MSTYLARLAVHGLALCAAALVMAGATLAMNILCLWANAKRRA